MLTKITDTFYIDLSTILCVLLVDLKCTIKFKDQQETLVIGKEKGCKLLDELDKYLKSQESIDVYDFPAA